MADPAVFKGRWKGDLAIMAFAAIFALTDLVHINRVGALLHLEYSGVTYLTSKS